MMKRLLLFVLVLNILLFAEPVKKAPWWDPLLQVISFNCGMWAWDRYYLDEGYAYISLNSMKNNIQHGFEWDNNEFGINYFGHPYQGSYYFNSARASGYGYYSSLGYTHFGSIQWEVFMESEWPSTNDLLTTSLGGASYGEILFRLSSRLFAEKKNKTIRRLSGTAIQPMAALNYYARQGIYHEPDKFPIQVDLRLTAGLHVISNSRYDSQNLTLEEEKWKGKFSGVSLAIQYGEKFVRVKKPFDEFQLTGSLIGDEDGNNIHISTSGTLANIAIKQRSHAFYLSLLMNSDVIYGNLVEMGANSLGVGIGSRVNLSKQIRFQLLGSGNWVFIGSSDFLYDNELINIESSDIKRSYQISMGWHLDGMISLEWIKVARLKASMDLFGLHTMPHAEPHYGAIGWDYVGLGDVLLEKDLPLGLSMGLSFNLYWKTGLYTGMLPISRTMGSLGLVLGYHF